MAGTGANALGGAATGAAAGSVFGPIGSGIGAGLGGLLGLFSGDDGEEKLQRDIKAMRARLQQQQAMIPGARSQALGQELGAYAPANEMLGRMYGQQAMVDPSKLTQSPIPEGMYGPPPSAPINGNGLSAGSADPNTVDPWTGWGGRPAQPRGR